MAENHIEYTLEGNKVEYIADKVELQLPIKNIQEVKVFGEKRYIFTDAKGVSYTFYKNIFCKKSAETQNDYEVCVFHFDEPTQKSK